MWFVCFFDVAGQVVDIAVVELRAGLSCSRDESRMLWDGRIEDTF